MEDMQKDLVLAINEYAYVLDKTKGHVSCWVGPCKTSLSTSDELVKFNKAAKKFLPVTKYSDAIHLFTTAPENWYIELKNPAADDRHPNAGGANSNPENVKIGCKVNIPGPCTFALYPGQMAQVIQGHSLRSNQYLVAKVYDANALNSHKEENGDTKHQEEYVNGQILIIKGTETSFYIPPTGIEVKAIDDNPSKGYIRDAVTLERLEYCILKDEDGNKRYVHGPKVVFPSPTESFIRDGNGHIRRNAIELSDISGVYLKVIADYKDEMGEHKAGDELFITGKEQMIYYPRPEHTFITYNGRIVHHAIAIPKGEGRYIMNRMTGEIKTVRGPAMYLPDPRVEVTIKRTLSRSQCSLWYPDNLEVLKVNGHDNTGYADVDLAVTNNVATFADSTMYTSSLNNYVGTPTTTTSNKVSRSNTFTPPRTISLNSSKYAGVVSIDVWTGYAVNVVSKSGERKVVCGPQTILLDYDQTLETLQLSTGKPKNTDKMEKTVFLRHENNRVSDIIEVETADFVKAQIKVSYLVNFDEKQKNKWFSVDNYVKHLCDWGRAKVKEFVRSITINTLCEDYHKAVEMALGKLNDKGNTIFPLHTFKENGMILESVEALDLTIQADIQKMMDKHQMEIVEKTLTLNAAKQSAEVERQIVELNREKIALKNELETLKMQTEAALEKEKFNLRVEAAKAADIEDKRKKLAEADIQQLKNEIFQAEEARKKAIKDAELAHKKEINALDMAREKASAEAMVAILEAVGPDMAAAMTAEQNKDVIKAIAGAISPYALAKGDNVADAVNKMVRGTTVEEVIQVLKKD